MLFDSAGSLACQQCRELSAWLARPLRQTDIPVNLDECSPDSHCAGCVAGAVCGGPTDAFYSVSLNTVVKGQIEPLLATAQ